MMSLDPVLLFFLLGLVAGLLRSEIRLPAAAYDLTTMILLLSIGIKGGIELHGRPLGGMAIDALAAVAMGLALPLLAFPVLRHLGKLSRADAGSIAAHYGSVSVATYAVAAAYFASRQIPYEAHMPFLLAVLEIPAILVGIVLARGFTTKMPLKEVARDVFLGKGIILLIGGLLIGWMAGPEGVAPVKPLFFDMFKGILAIFLLEMGLVTASQIAALRKCGIFLLFFGIAMPLFSSAVGIAIGMSLGFSLGGTAMFGILAASASYIAVPAAMRISVPEANPGLSLAVSLGVTFPFNVLFGIGLYHGMARWAFELVGR
ncbi:MAG: hypothetical protein RL318_2715 [Fibrobacterota bacterium]